MVSARIICSFRYKDGQFSQEFTESLRLYNRNAVTWDDDRKAAAFVTARDPAVMTFAKRIASWVKEKPARGMQDNLRIAMAAFEALRLAGLSYVKDPSTPFATFSQDEMLVDYLNTDATQASDRYTPTDKPTLKERVEAKKQGEQAGLNDRDHFTLERGTSDNQMEQVTFARGES